jgi:hypothetical protein
MATTSRITVDAAKRLPGRRYDHEFFTCMIVIMFCAVAVPMALSQSRTRYAGLIHFSRRACSLRPLVNAQDPSRYAVGQLVIDCR